MLSYQHGYHAGGPADVHKHAALCAVLDHLCDKEKPFAVIDLHAGHGVYDLASGEAQKTKEFENGIGRVWPLRGTNDVPFIIEKLFAALTALNPDGRLARYPGSPALARAALRAEDLLILNELHPAASADLKRWVGRDRRIGVHKRDALEALVALTPPPIRRGLAIIDPSYEIKSEYADVPETVRKALRKWREGIYLVWYPILTERRHTDLVGGMQNLDAESLACELMFDRAKDGEASGLRGTGVIVVNPPWQFDDTMREAGDWLARNMTRSGRHEVRWLKRDALV